MEQDLSYEPGNQTVSRDGLRGIADELLERFEDRQKLWEVLTDFGDKAELVPKELNRIAITNVLAYYSQNGKEHVFAELLEYLTNTSNTGTKLDSLITEDIYNNALGKDRYVVINGSAWIGPDKEAIERGHDTEWQSRSEQVVECHILAKMDNSKYKNNSLKKPLKPKEEAAKNNIQDYYITNIKGVLRFNGQSLKANDYLGLLEVLHEHMPMGGEIQYEKLETLLKQQNKKLYDHGVRQKEGLRKWIYKQLTQEDRGLRAQTKMELVTVSGENGLVFHNEKSKVQKS